MREPCRGIWLAIWVMVIILVAVFVFSASLTGCCAEHAEFRAELIDLRHRVFELERPRFDATEATK